MTLRLSVAPWVRVPISLPSPDTLFLSLFLYITSVYVCLEGIRVKEKIDSKEAEE